MPMVNSTAVFKFKGITMSMNALGIDARAILLQEQRVVNPAKLAAAQREMQDFGAVGGAAVLAKAPILVTAPPLLDSPTLHEGRMLAAHVHRGVVVNRGISCTLLRYVVQLNAAGYEWVVGGGFDMAPGLLEPQRGEGASGIWAAPGQTARRPQLNSSSTIDYFFVSGNLGPRVFEPTVHGQSAAAPRQPAQRRFAGQGAKKHGEEDWAMPLAKALQAKARGTARDTAEQELLGRRDKAGGQRHRHVGRSGGLATALRPAKRRPPAHRARLSPLAGACRVAARWARHSMGACAFVAKSLRQLQASGAVRALSSMKYSKLACSLLETKSYLDQVARHREIIAQLPQWAQVAGDIVEHASTAAEKAMDGKQKARARCAQDSFLKGAGLSHRATKPRALQLALPKWTERDRIARPANACDEEVEEWANIWRCHELEQLQRPHDIDQWEPLPTLTVGMLQAAALSFPTSAAIGPARIGIRALVHLRWSRTRATVSKAWLSAHPRADIWGMGGGGSSSDTAFDLNVETEISAELGEHALAVLMGARDLGLPLRLVGVLLELYRQPRGLCAFGSISCDVVAWQGVLAGCTRACAMVSLLLHRLLQRIRCLGVVPRALIDDVTLHMADFMVPALDTPWAAATRFREGALEFGIISQREKSGHVTPSAAVAQRFRQHGGARGLKGRRWARNPGHDLCGRRRARRQTAEKMKCAACGAESGTPGHWLFGCETLLEPELLDEEKGEVLPERRNVAWALMRDQGLKMGGGPQARGDFALSACPPCMPPSAPPEERTAKVYYWGDWSADPGATHEGNAVLSDGLGLASSIPESGAAAGQRRRRALLQALLALSPQHGGPAVDVVFADLRGFAGEAASWGAALEQAGATQAAVWRRLRARPARPAARWTPARIELEKFQERGVHPLLLMGNTRAGLFAKEGARARAVPQGYADFYGVEIECRRLVAAYIARAMRRVLEIPSWQATDTAARPCKRPPSAPPVAVARHQLALLRGGRVALCRRRRRSTATARGPSRAQRLLSPCSESQVAKLMVDAVNEHVGATWAQVSEGGPLATAALDASQGLLGPGDLAETPPTLWALGDTAVDVQGHRLRRAGPAILCQVRVAWSGSGAPRALLEPRRGMPTGEGRDARTYLSNSGAEFASRSMLLVVLGTCEPIFGCEVLWAIGRGAVGWCLIGRRSACPGGGAGGALERSAGGELPVQVGDFGDLMLSEAARPGIASVCRADLMPLGQCLWRYVLSYDSACSSGGPPLPYLECQVLVWTQAAAVGEVNPASPLDPAALVSSAVSTMLNLCGGWSSSAGSSGASLVVPFCCCLKEWNNLTWPGMDPAAACQAGGELRCCPVKVLVLIDPDSLQTFWVGIFLWNGHGCAVLAWLRAALALLWQAHRGEGAAHASPRGAGQRQGSLLAAWSAASKRNTDGVAGSSAPCWGAWTSHSFMSHVEASDSARETWGVPTSRARFEVLEPDSGGRVLAYGEAPFVHLGDGLGPLGSIVESAKVTVGSLPWAGVPGPAPDDAPPGWQRALREDRAARGEGAAPASAAGDDAEATPALPWFVPEELELVSLSGCLPVSGTSFRAAGRGPAADGAGRLLTYTARLRPRRGRVLPARRPSGGSGVVPRVGGPWIPLFGLELADVDVEVDLPVAA
ncbi:unnamed protein product [Prorocentrum cordatum]|uniref:Uncharacterized protein n=1 Tax=Prorocentrum cordatum TaxID=2364126 RepID=A0ABN9WCP2_9DINO|nr:unnamed protein product [Polarella glacialis]